MTAPFRLLPPCLLYQMQQGQRQKQSLPQPLTSPGNFSKGAHNSLIKPPPSEPAGVAAVYEIIIFLFNDGIPR